MNFFVAEKSKVGVPIIFKLLKNRTNNLPENVKFILTEHRVCFTGTLRIRFKQ